jgi:TrmH family RNA methyltransferase
MNAPAVERLANIVIVLDEPQDVVNIAGVVRVMMNMGLTRLRLVRPDPFDERRIDGIAHRNERVRAAMETYDCLADAVADATYVVGTSARPRAVRTNASHPRTIAPTLLDRAAEGTVAILFGREDRGLRNEGLDLCHEVIVIPTDPDCSSLNLAQACLVVCYELLLASSAFAGEDGLGRGKRVRQAPPATQADIERMYTALERGLERVDFFSAREASTVLRSLRTLLGRAEPDLRESKLLEAIGYQIERHLDRLGREPES